MPHEPNRRIHGKGKRRRKNRPPRDVSARADALRLSDARYREIEDLCAELDDLPDGAFLGVLEECGVDVDELEAYSDEQARRENAQPPKRRGARFQTFSIDETHGGA